jgi:hypothetical protein
MHFDNEDEIWSIPVARIQDHADPVLTPPWRLTAPLKQQDVIRRIAVGRGEAPNDLSDPWPVLEASPLGADEQDPARHAARIAYLMTNGWSDPISIDVGVPWASGHAARWIVDDGNHRLYAAIALGHREICVSLGGCLQTCADMFQIDCAGWRPTCGAELGAF